MSEDGRLDVVPDMEPWEWNETRCRRPVMGGYLGRCVLEKGHDGECSPYYPEGENELSQRPSRARSALPKGEMLAPAGIRSNTMARNAAQIDGRDPAGNPAGRALTDEGYDANICNEHEWAGYGDCPGCLRDYPEEVADMHKRMDYTFKEQEGGE